MESLQIKLEQIRNQYFDISDIQKFHFQEIEDIKYLI